MYCVEWEVDDRSQGAWWMISGVGVVLGQEGSRRMGSGSSWAFKEVSCGVCGFLGRLVENMNGMDWQRILY